MRNMTQNDLFEKYLARSRSGDALNLHIEGDKLIHYQTAILERCNGKFIFNYTRYSLATGKVQKMITNAVSNDQLIYVTGVPAGTRNLRSYHSDLISDMSSVKPDRYLMEVEHSAFGHGCVLSIAGQKMECLFRQQTKTLLYPDSITQGIVKVISSNRQ